MIEELPRPTIVHRCLRCRVTVAEVSDYRVVVSPTGTAHHGADWGKTVCGIDATGENWWWPL